MSLLSDPDGDVIRDSLALIETAHARDFEGMAAILGNGAPHLIAAFTARICADLVADLAAWHDASQDDMLTALRESWAPS